MSSFDDKYSKLSPALKSGIHELYLEGIPVSEDMVDEFLLLENNDITEEEFIKRAVDRALSHNE